MNLTVGHLKRYKDIARLLELGAKLGAPLILVPIYGRNRKFPGMDTGRTPEEDEALWLEGLRIATHQAEAVGAEILVEPINRYENSVTITVADAVRQIGVTEVTYGTSFWMGRSSTACVRPRS